MVIVLEKYIATYMFINPMISIGSILPVSGEHSVLTEGARVPESVFLPQSAFSV